MTISSENRKAGPFTGNGSTTSFPFTFKVFTKSDLQVVRRDANGVEHVLVLDSDYSVTLNADQDNDPGGAVTFPLSGSALPSTQTLTIAGALDYLQPADITNQGGFYPQVVENALDRNVILLQQLKTLVESTLKLAISTPAGTNTTLPAPEANKLIGWNETANALQNVNPATLATLVAYGTARGDIFTGDGTTTQFTLTDNPGALNNLDVAVGGITQLPGVDYSWNGGTLVTFTLPPPTGEKVLVRYMQGLPFGTVDIDDVGGFVPELHFLTQHVQYALTEIGRRISGGLNVLTKMTLAEQVDAFSGSPALDHTASIVAANASSNVLIFPAGYTFNVTNWEPLAGTIIAADGATIQRFSNATFGATGSSGAVIITNDDVEVQSGKWQDKAGLTSNTWSGAFVINGGDNFRLHHGYEITGTWGAITGHAAQNGSLVSKNMVVANGWMHHNIHNSYFADVDGLTFTGNISEYSDRDGFKTYRNVLNVIACLNHCRYNGNGTAGQSQDGMDFFIGGERCIVALNFLHNNVGKGIDIKRNASGAAETVQNRNYIIGLNFVFSNGDIGLQTEEADSAGKMSDLTITANHIFGNTGRGAYLGSLQNSQFIGNHTYDNGADGLRVDTADGLVVAQNVAYGNSTTGYNIVSGTGITATGNIGRGGGVQTNGMLWGESASGKCCDNDITGHTTDYLASGTNPQVRGKVLDSKIANTTASQLVAMSRKGAVSRVELLLNNTATMTATLSKRSEVDGTSAGNITSASAKSFPTAYVPGVLGISGTNSARQLAGGNALLLTLAGITSSFTDGICRVHFID